MLVALLASIPFAAPGPWQRVTYADTEVRAEIRYRLAKDARYGPGPAEPEPSISTGTLVVTMHGRTRRYDLATVLPIHERRVTLPGPRGQGGCGARDALLRRGPYLAIETQYSGKGCDPGATFIDLRDGRVAIRAYYDTSSGGFRGEPRTVAHADPVTLRRSVFDGEHPKSVPWQFIVASYTDGHGRRGLISYERAPLFTGTDTAPIPRVGTNVEIGAVDRDLSRPWTFTTLPLIRYKR